MKLVISIYPVFKFEKNSFIKKKIFLIEITTFYTINKFFYWNTALFDKAKIAHLSATIRSKFKKTVQTTGTTETWWRFTFQSFLLITLKVKIFKHKNNLHKEKIYFKNSTYIWYLCFMYAFLFFLRGDTHIFLKMKKMGRWNQFYLKNIRGRGEILN